MTGLYVYGIVGADHPRRTTRLVAVGDTPQPLRAVEVWDLAALVSGAPEGLRARRRDLLAHHAVLDALVAQGAVLPMRFGTVAPDEQSLRTEIEQNGARYRALLAELADRVELNVKVLPDEEHLLRQVATEEPVVRQLRGGAQTYERRLALGQVVAAALRERQDDVARRVLGALEPLAVRTVTGPPVAGCALNAGFLVDTGSTEAFVAAVRDLELALGGATRLRCTGPLPPYSFVTADG
jgi:hypothetical protein